MYSKSARLIAAARTYLETEKLNMNLLTLVKSL